MGRPWRGDWDRAAPRSGLDPAFPPLAPPITRSAPASSRGILAPVQQLRRRPCGKARSGCATRKRDKQHLLRPHHAMPRRDKRPFHEPGPRAKDLAATQHAILDAERHRTAFGIPHAVKASGPCITSRLLLLGARATQHHHADSVHRAFTEPARRQACPAHQPKCLDRSLGSSRLRPPATTTEFGCQRGGEDAPRSPPNSGRTAFGPGWSPMFPRTGTTRTLGAGRSLPSPPRWPAWPAPGPCPARSWSEHHGSPDRCGPGEGAADHAPVTSPRHLVRERDVGRDRPEPLLRQPEQASRRSARP